MGLALASDESLLKFLYITFKVTFETSSHVHLKKLVSVFVAQISTKSSDAFRRNVPTLNVNGHVETEHSFQGNPLYQRFTIPYIWLTENLLRATSKG